MAILLVPALKRARRPEGTGKPCKLRPEVTIWSMVRRFQRWRTLVLLVMGCISHGASSRAEERKETFDQLDLGGAESVVRNDSGRIDQAKGHYRNHGARWQFDATEMNPDWAIDGAGLAMRDTLIVQFPTGVTSLSFRYRGVYEAAAVTVWIDGKQVVGDLSKHAPDGPPGDVRLNRKDLPDGPLEIVIKPVHWCLIDDVRWTPAPAGPISAQALPDGTGIEVHYTGDHGLKIGDRPDLEVQTREQNEGAGKWIFHGETTVQEVRGPRTVVLSLADKPMPPNGWSVFRIVSGKDFKRKTHVRRTEQMASVYRHWPAFIEPMPLGAVAQPWSEVDGIIPGWDWSLPPETRPSPRSAVRFGFKGWKQLAGIPRPAGTRVVDELWWSWDKLEPEEGKFDFDRLREAIRERIDAGCDGIVLRLLASRWAHESLEGPTPEYWKDSWSAPRWLEGRGIPLIEEIRGGKRIRTFEITHPEYHELYRRMVHALGESGILASENLFGALVCWKSSSEGEEGEGYEGDDPEAEERTRDRMRLWAEAMGEEKKGRLMWVGSVDPPGKNYLELARELGIGQRSGFVETVLINAPNEQLGQRITDDRYLVVDESNAFLSGEVLFGDENEEYSADDPLHGAPGTMPYRYHNSMLRFLQMRRSYLYARERSPDPEILNYVLLALGRTVADSPDAWCALRENYLSRFGHESSPGPLRNFERWIYQRDRPGFETEAVEAFPHPVEELWLADQKRRYQCIARKGEHIGFAIDDRFLLGKDLRVVVKITYLDQGGGLWRFREGNEPDGRVLGDMQCEDTGELRTATFHLENADFSASGEEFDFVISGADGYRPAIAFVRVVKLP